MSGPVTIHHDLFLAMIHDHKNIASYLKDIDTADNRKELRELIHNLWHKSELEHHYKEEALLFDNIYLNPKIQEGGPMCSLYFDFHMSEKVKELVEQVTGTSLRVESHQLKILETKCPLTIPIEEHRAGKDLLCYIQNQFETLSPTDIKKYLLLYKKIQTAHIQKEESCLYHLCASLLTQTQADKILELWKKMRLRYDDKMHA